jgi:hypothetical protein
MGINLSPVTLILVRNNQKAYDNNTAGKPFIGVSDTADKFFIGVVDTGNKTVLAKSACVLLETRIKNSICTWKVHSANLMKKYDK